MADPHGGTCLVCLGPEYAGPPEPTAEAMLAALRTVLVDREAVYVSSPITTGPRYLRWLQRTGGSSVDRESIQFKEHVVAPNLATASRVIRQARDSYFPGRPVIDPTALGDRPDWEQHRYHSFWLSVIREFVGTVLFIDGWEYSTGCTLEYIEAVSADIPLLTESLEPLRSDFAATLLAQADDAYASLGIEVPALVVARSLVHEPN